MADKVRDYSQLARDIVDIVGGEENISHAVHCATRLRLTLRERPTEAKERVASLPGVITVVENNRQFQIVIGSHVTDVFAALKAQTNISTEEDGKSRGSILNQVIATMSAVFAPFIYILAAAGFIQGALILVRLAFPSFADSGTDQVLSLISWAPFTFLPIFIALTAAQHFKTNLYTAVFCCSALVSPSVAELSAAIQNGEALSLFGMPLSSTVYTSTVIPPLVLVWLLSYLERFLSKKIPGVAGAIFVPFICALVMVPLTFMLLGPISAGGANAVANGYNWLVDTVPVLAAAIVGIFWQCIVIFGFHWGITPMVLAKFDQYGFDSFQVFQTAAVLGQVGAAFGVFCRARSKKLRGLALSASGTGIFGITEPAIFGVNLRLKRPFIAGCLAGGIGAVVIALFGSRQYVYAGLPGVLTIPNSYSPDNSNSLLGVIVGCAVTLICGAIFAAFSGFDNPRDSEAIPVERNDEKLAAERSAYDAALLANGSVARLHSPVNGDLLSLDDVPDEVFASGAMGQGVAINPESTTILSPCDGEIVTLFPSKHALGLRCENGVEILIHVGLDTVTLNGSAFESHVIEGQKVTLGQPLLTFDIDAIEKAGLSPLTPVLITNAADFGRFMPRPGITVEAGEEIGALIPTEQMATRGE